MYDASWLHVFLMVVYWLCCVIHDPNGSVQYMNMHAAWCVSECRLASCWLIRYFHRGQAAICALILMVLTPTCMCTVMSWRWSTLLFIG
jgi:hypothetical protein